MDLQEIDRNRWTPASGKATLSLRACRLRNLMKVVQPQPGKIVDSTLLSSLHSVLRRDFRLVQVQTHDFFPHLVSLASLAGCSDSVGTLLQLRKRHPDAEGLFLCFADRTLLAGCCAAGEATRPPIKLSPVKMEDQPVPAAS
jgi:hypothetical protein